MVLNAINNIKVNNLSISVEEKQKLYETLFIPNNTKGNKTIVTYKSIYDYFVSNGLIEKGKEDTISGIDKEFKISIKPYFDFNSLITNKKISFEDAENIIEHSTYIESKTRFLKWIKANYSLSEEDTKYISNKKYSEFGRLSAELLNNLEGISLTTGEVGTVMYFLWNTNDNLMQIIGDAKKYDFKEKIENITREYYCNNPKNINDKLDDMKVSNGVKRPIFRTLEILSDIVKIQKRPPSKIFVEMARDFNDNTKKGSRSPSRKTALLELYKNLKTQETQELIMVPYAKKKGESAQKCDKTGQT